MHNFREFEAGPDPFGRKFRVYFKWLQTAISIRHADTVDVKFVLVPEGEGPRIEKTIALPHADMLRAAQSAKRELDDPWCARIAAMHVIHLIETGEDMEKDLVTLSLAEIQSYAENEQKAEREAVTHVR